MERVFSENLSEAKSVFLLKSERNLQTIIGGEKVTIQEGDKIAFIVGDVNPISQSVAGIFSIQENATAFECDKAVYLDMISELMILTAKTK